MAAPPDSVPRDWGPVMRFFHWSTVVLILAMFTLGWLAVSYPMSPTKIELFTWHKSLGLLVLASVLPRLAWRLTHPAPPLPPDMTRLERRAARVSHALLYGLLIAMPLAGWVINSAADFPLKWFGLFRVPDLVGPDEGTQRAAELVHLLLSYALGALIVLHAAAALHHHFARGNDVLRRMLPFAEWRRR